MSESQQQQTKSVFVSIQSTQINMKDKGNPEKGVDPRDRNVYTISVEDAAKLAAALMENIQEGKPTKLDFRTGTAIAKSTGRHFPSSFLMVRPVEPKAGRETSYEASTKEDPVERAKRIAASFQNKANA